MITSRQNPTIQNIKKLLSSSKARKDAATFVLESPTLIKEALNRHPELIQEIVFTDAFSEFEDLSSDKIKTTLISPDIADYVSSLKSSPGTIALLSYPTYPAVKSFNTGLYLDGINKPANLGAILRNAAAFNCDIVFLSATCCDPFHPESIRASAGHYASTPLVISTLEKVTETFPNTQLYFCDSNAKNAVSQTTASSPKLLILGSENGLSDATSQFQHPENSIRIPMNTAVDSLNVAVTSGILLHALFTTRST